MLSASNLPPPHEHHSPSDPTTVLLLPAFTIVENVTPNSVPDLIKHHINPAPTSTTPFHSQMSEPPPPDISSLSLDAAPSTRSDDTIPAQTFTASSSNCTTRPCPHKYLILLCSQKTRDARCGQSAPLLRREFERHLRPLGLYRDLQDERPGGVGIYFISHVGGHKYSANLMIYRRGEVEGTDPAAGDGYERNRHASSRVLVSGDKQVEGGGIDGLNGTFNGDEATAGTANGKVQTGGNNMEKKNVWLGEGSQCIWLARVRPEDCEGIVKHTILKGKVIKPERQLRGGFDRQRGLVSWRLLHSSVSIGVYGKAHLRDRQDVDVLYK